MTGHRRHRRRAFSDVEVEGVSDKEQGTPEIPSSIMYESPERRNRGSRFFGWR